MDQESRPEIEVTLNGNFFTEDDPQAVEARLQPQFRVRSNTRFYYWTPTPGELPPAEVIVAVLYSVLPLGDVAINLISQALYDRLKAYASRVGRRDIKVIYEVKAVDKDWNLMHRRMQVEASNFDDIKWLIEQVNDAASRTSDDD